MPSKRKRWRTVAVAALVVCGIVGLGLVGLRSALHRVPDFYAEAIVIPAAAQEAAGETLERNVLALHNEVRDSRQWSAVFTDEQINGWLAADLPEKFPQVLPPELQDPRVAFVPGQLQIACRYADDTLTSVVSLTLEVRLAEEPNTLAVRICGAGRGTGSSSPQATPRPCHGVRAQRGPAGPLGPVRRRSGRAGHIRRVRSPARECTSRARTHRDPRGRSPVSWPHSTAGAMRNQSVWFFWSDSRHSPTLRRFAPPPEARVVRRAGDRGR